MNERPSNPGSPPAEATSITMRGQPVALTVHTADSLRGWFLRGVERFGPLKGSQMRICRVLAEFVDTRNVSEAGNPVVFVSLSVITKRAGLKRAIVPRSLKDLDKLGIINRHVGGGQYVTAYELVLDRGELPPVYASRQVAPTGARSPYLPEYTGVARASRQEAPTAVDGSHPVDRARSAHAGNVKNVLNDDDDVGGSECGNLDERQREIVELLCSRDFLGDRFDRFDAAAIAEDRRNRSWNGQRLRDAFEAFDQQVRQGKRINVSVKGYLLSMIAHAARPMAPGEKIPDHVREKRQAQAQRDAETRQRQVEDAAIAARSLELWRVADAPQRRRYAEMALELFTPESRGVIARRLSRCVDTGEIPPQYVLVKISQAVQAQQEQSV